VLASVVGCAAASGEWEDFKAKFGRFYNGDEDDKRHAIFDANMEFIQTENAKGHSYVLGVTQFADVTAEEFTSTYLGYKQDESDLPAVEAIKYDGVLADSLDWREQGVITPVKDQGQCGSCWAFSTTGALEGGYALATGTAPVALAEQQFVDCAGFPNLGCNGGNMKFGLRYAKDHDICGEASYAYEAKGGSCRTAGCDVALASGTVTAVTGLSGVLSKASDDDLMGALQNQPISIAVEADQTIFHHYVSGVVTGDCGSKTDHGVLLVGYGTDGSDDYWLVKNSWAADWGEAGYIRLVRGKNQCGINSGPNYPVFGSSVSV